MSRDIQAASEVARRAELGWFDVEFTMYGSAYLENGKRYYQVSAEAEKIYESIDRNLQSGFLPTNVISMTEKVPVPVGMRDFIALEVKKELSLQMQQYYPIEFFVYLEQLAEKIEENTAFDFLDRERERLENCFDAKKLENFELLVEYMYLRRKIDTKNYRLFKDWLMNERKYMDIVIVQKGKSKRQFYGFGYKTIASDTVQYISNARKEVVYEKQYELERQGILVTPIFTELYEQPQDVRLPQIRKQFEDDLKRFADYEYINNLQLICTKNSCMERNEFMKCLSEVEDNFGQYARMTLEQYGYRWGILYE
ncbi:MAG: hypothetical protein IJC12_04165 [Peptococcaceae bacterium]|nr:hypothetical protein [Peptococcaceae bacterium]